MKNLVLGGARSGKSKHAQQLAADTLRQVVYIATATANDEEMANRIAHHRTSRPQNWKLVEEPIHLADTISLYSSPDDCVLVDCLTLWVSNLMFPPTANGSPVNMALFEKETRQLLSLLPTVEGNIILVSNEVGHGVIPLGAETRRYVDEMGFLHQQLAALCDNVILVTAGLPQILKGA